ncbi:acyl carrier protein [Bacillus weihaiensis]|uniref:acyl carrier protein n=1 Tax=Bacillus weihaiensis TaxID=1547283 RepID=UPI0023578DE0|nr:acyl carrier protein [Bacillus weihaiensis]
MEKKEIVYVIREILKEMGFTEELSREIDINESLLMIGLDSIRFMELVISIEARFNIVIEDSVLTMDNFSTIENIATYLMHLPNNINK